MHRDWQLSLFFLVIGLTGMIWFGYETSWQAAVALFLCMWSNNYFQTPLVIIHTAERPPPPADASPVDNTPPP